VQEVREFIDAHVSEPQHRDTRLCGGEWGTGELRALRLELANKGWLALTWPRRWGGLERSMVDQVLMMDEFAYFEVPSIDITSASIAPAIIRNATEAQCQSWLPRISSGEIELAVGYSEPDAGSDLASLRTSAKATAEGHWVVNGRKLWCTGAQHASHVWLLCRTDPDAPPHKGLSVLIVDLSTPGITVTPIETWRGVVTTQIDFDEVEVPGEHLIGEPGKGWRYVTEALDFERTAIGITGGLRRLLDDLVGYVREQGLEADPEVSRRIGWLHAQVELARLLNYRAAWMIDQGQVPYAESSITKVFTTELHALAHGLAVELLGEQGAVDPWEQQAALSGRAQLGYRAAPYLRFGGGTNEIQRDIIAQAGLGLPRL
jgi:alkylation response protein AidB-like acyl-CoA dehydrogenase